MYLFHLHTTSHDLLQMLSKVNASARMNLSSVLDYDQHDQHEQPDQHEQHDQHDQHVHSLPVDRVAPGCGRQDNCSAGSLVNIC